MGNKHFEIFSKNSRESPQELFSAFELPATFRIKKWTKILLTIAAPFMIALFVWMLLMPVLQPTDQMNKAYWFLAMVSVSMIVVFVIGIIDTWKSKLIISKAGIKMYDFRGSRELLLNDMKGYRIADKYLFIEPTNDNDKRIKITKYYEDIDAIIAWLKCYLPDLDAVNLLEEQQQILADDNYGVTTEEREARLKQAKNISKLINAVGIGAAICLFVWPGRYAIITCILVPLFALAAITYFKGLIKVDEKKGSAHPSVFTGILLASCGLLVKGIAGYNIFDYKGIWLPAAAITLLYLFLLLNSSREYQQTKNYWPVVFLALFLFGYGYGAVVNINCAFDDSLPVVYHSQVISKRINRGSKSTSYYLELAAWGPQTKNDEVTVSKTMYQSVSEQDAVPIYFNKGVLKIPWFRVSRL
jgi:hypothetical protein